LSAAEESRPSDEPPDWLPREAAASEEEAHPELDISTVYVSFSAEIIPHTTESLIATMANCANQGASTVISSCQLRAGA